MLGHSVLHTGKHELFPRIPHTSVIQMAEGLLSANHRPLGNIPELTVLTYSDMSPAVQAWGRVRIPRGPHQPASKPLVPRPHGKSLQVRKARTNHSLKDQLKSRCLTEERIEKAPVAL